MKGTPRILPRSSFGLLLFSAAFVVSLAVCLVGIHTMTDSRNTAVRLAEVRSRNLARSADQDVTTMLNQIDHALSSVAGWLEVDLEAEGSLNVTRLKMGLEREAKQLPAAEALWVTDADGVAILGSSGVTGGESFVDYPFVSFLKDNPKAGLYVTGPIREAPTREWEIITARRYNLPDGRFGGVVVAPVLLARLEASLPGYEVGPGGVRILLDSDGGFVVRHPSVIDGRAIPVGDRTIADPIRSMLLAGVPEETYFARTPFDQRMRMFTFRRLEKLPFIALAGLAEDDYLAQWRKDRSRTLGVIAAFIVGAWIMAGLLWRAWKGLEDTTAALMESEAKYRSLVETAQELVWACDKQGRFTYLNPAWEKTHGYEIEEMIGRGLGEFQRPESLAKNGRELARAFAGGTVKEYETTHIAKDGRELTLLINAVPKRNAQGEVIGTQGTAIDITERKLREEERAGALHALRHLEAIDRIIQRAGARDLPSMLREILAAMLDIFGSDRAWLVHPADPEAAAWKIHMEKARPGYSGTVPPGEPMPMDEAVRRILALTLTSPHGVAFGPGADHPLPPGRLTASSNALILLPIIPKKGAPWALGMHQCSHPRVWTLAERNLLVQIGLRVTDGLNSMLFLEDIRASENRFRGTLARLAEGCMIIGFDWICLYANEVAAGHGPRARGDLTGRSITDLYPEKSAIFRRYRVCMEERIPQRFEEDFVFADGTRRTFTFNVSPVPEGIFVLSIDITETRRKEAEVKALERKLASVQKLESLGSLAGGVAHDMNNVLSAILGISTLNKEGLPAGSPLAQDMESITKACQRGASLVKGLLGFARKDLGEDKVFDLNALVHDQAALLERTTLRKVRLETDMAPDLHAVHGDSGALAHALMNLCVNAVDAMPEGGVLTLRTCNVGPSRVLLEVTDTGCGMPKEILDKALDPFFTTKPEGKGTGLGLSMVYGTVTSHGGSLDIRSAPGEGTTVSILLPASKEKPVPPDKAAPVTAGPMLHVLLVDDDELVRQVTEQLLTALGHVPTGVGSGEEALETLESGLLCDVVILDLNMPGLGGAATLKRIRARRPDLHVLLATGRADQSAQDLAASLPRVKLMPKPFTFGDLQRHLEEIV